MISSVTRLFLLRILPRRLVPLLTAVEVALLVQRWRRSRQPAPGPHPAAGPDPAATTTPARASRRRGPRVGPRGRS